MKKYLILFSIVVLALYLRLYNFENRLTFGSEQARSLIVAAKYIKEKPSLLGQEYFRANSYGHKLFTSALFNYSLVPLLILYKYDPFPITVYFALLNVVIGIILYILTEKVFNRRVAIFATTLYMFNSYMIYHSMFIWVLNYMPLIGLLSAYYVFKVFKNKIKTIDLIVLGVLSGIGFGLEYLYVLAIIICVVLVIYYSKNRTKSLLLFMCGFAIGDFPQIIFDLKHDFYHFRSLYQYAIDTVSGSSDAGFVYYHFLHFWPIVIIIFGYLLHKLYLKNRPLSIFVLLIYLSINLSSDMINYSRPVGMVEGLRYADIIESAREISNLSGNNFNVVTLYDFDTRGYVLRYFLRYVFNKEPLSEVEYPSSSEIFSLASDKYDFYNNNPWELNVFKPYNVSVVKDFSGGYRLSKLYK